MTTESMLTTVDNPYDPFEQFTMWLAWDEQHGYFTASLLARLAYTSDELSDADQRRAIEMAMDEIVEFNLSGVHKKVSREVPDQLVVDEGALDTQEVS